MEEETSVTNDGKCKKCGHPRSKHVGNHCNAQKQSVAGYAPQRLEYCDCKAFEPNYEYNSE